MTEKLDPRLQRVVNDIVAGKVFLSRACNCSNTRRVLEAAYEQVCHDPNKSTLAQELRDQIAHLWPEALPLSA